MFLFTRNYLLVPQPLYTALLLGGGILAPLAAGTALWYLLKKEDWRRFAFWGVVFTLAALAFLLASTQRIVGWEMIGG